MIMKQTVEEAAYDYATNKTKFRKDVLKEVDADTYVLRHADSMDDFQCGAEWQSKQSPWISVKERLPEAFEPNLILLKDGQVRVASLDFQITCMTEKPMRVLIWKMLLHLCPSRLLMIY